VVFNGHYFLYFDVAVAEYWRAIGFRYPDDIVEKFGTDIYAVKASAEYHGSATYDELIDIGCRVGRIGRSSMQLVFGIWRGAEHITSGELIYVNADLKRGNRPRGPSRSNRRSSISSAPGLRKRTRERETIQILLRGLPRRHGDRAARPYSHARRHPRVRPALRSAAHSPRRRSREALDLRRTDRERWQTASLTTRMMCDSYLLDSSSLGSPGMKEVSWPRPVRPGDTLRLRMTVLETKPSTSKPDRGSVLHRWEVFNQAGEPVLRMEGIGCSSGATPPESGAGHPTASGTGATGRSCSARTLLAPMAGEILVVHPVQFLRSSLSASRASSG